MADIATVLTDVTKQLGLALSSLGYAKRGKEFHKITQSGNRAIIALQKSLKSTKRHAYVTMNYGVYSKLVAGRCPMYGKESPGVCDAHWRKRWRSNDHENWLEVTEGSSPEDIAGILIDAAMVLVRELEAMSSDEGLRDEWLSGRSPGVGRMQRLLFLAIVMNEVGPVDRVDETVSSLRQLVTGTVHEGLVEEQLRRAQVIAEK